MDIELTEDSNLAKHWMDGNNYIEKKYILKSYWNPDDISSNIKEENENSFLFTFPVMFFND